MSLRTPISERTQNGRDMSDLIERLRETGCDREPFTPSHKDCVCRLTNAAADEIERLRRELGVKTEIVKLLRAQLRVIGHAPMVVETEEIGWKELEMLSKSLGN